ncbi:hypothetical protein ACLBKS_06825 [Hylemonella sp. W303a]|uniref:hypothetical protein n=1 Tax=Hylemonella sp. W303a TaxID=3389873 RepID=UPI00396B0C79
MPFDDDDAKIRRNLVVYSTIVLALAWFGLPAGLLLEAALPKSFINPPDYKFWAFGFAILAYLGIRYSFSKEGSSYRDSIERDYKNLEFEKSKKFAEYAAHLYARFGFHSRIFQSNIEDCLKDLLGNVSSAELAEMGRPRFFPVFSSAEKTPWEFYIHLDPKWEMSGHTRISVNGGKRILVQINGVPKLVVVSWAKVHAWTYSKSSIQHLMPALLGVAASSVLWTRVMQAYWAVW